MKKVLGAFAIGVAANVTVALLDSAPTSFWDKLRISGLSLGGKLTLGALAVGALVMLAYLKWIYQNASRSEEVVRLANLAIVGLLLFSCLTLARDHFLHGAEAERSRLRIEQLTLLAEKAESIDHAVDAHMATFRKLEDRLRDTHYSYEAIAVDLYLSGSTGIVEHVFNGRPVGSSRDPEPLFFFYGGEAEVEPGRKLLAVEDLTAGSPREIFPTLEEAVEDPLNTRLYQIPGFAAPFEYRRRVVWPCANNRLRDAFIVMLKPYQNVQAHNVPVRFFSSGAVDEVVVSAIVEDGDMPALRRVVATPKKVEVTQHGSELLGTSEPALAVGWELPKGAVGYVVAYSRLDTPHKLSSERTAR